MTTLTLAWGRNMKRVDRSPVRGHAGRRAAAMLTAVLAGFLAGVGAQPAVAGYAESARGYFTAGGTQFSNYAYISTSAKSATAVTSTQRTGGGTPSGWAGSRGRLFTSGGAMSCEGVNSYNSGSGTVAFGYSCTRRSGGTWYSYGVSIGWNGSGYSSFYTYRSPSQNS